MVDPANSRNLVSRRRAISIVAGAAAWMWTRDGHGAPTTYHEWFGTALGAPASIRLYDPDRGRARAAVESAVCEIERLETEFSLYRPTSALSHLNRDGRLDGPSHDMRRLLAECRRISELTEGTFDVTVQPLWTLYAAHFEEYPDSRSGPSPAAVVATRSKVDYRRVRVDEACVRIDAGMAVTFNGIAQGYVTDSVANLLRRDGWRSVLIDLGEMRALGQHPDGRPWRVALRGARGDATVALEDGALATSAWNGTVFDRAGRFGHLFDPRQGPVRSRWLSLSVVAASATTADALSTALALSPDGKIPEFARRAGAEAVWGLDGDGRPVRLFG